MKYIVYSQEILDALCFKENLSKITLKLQFPVLFAFEDNTGIKCGMITEPYEAVELLSHCGGPKVIQSKDITVLDTPDKVFNNTVLMGKLSPLNNLPIDPITLPDVASVAESSDDSEHVLDSERSV